LSSTTITGGYNSYGKTMFLRVGITGTFSGSGAQVPLITVPTQPVDSTETFSCIVSLAGVIIPCSVTNTSGTTYQVKFYNNSAWANGSTYTIGITGSYETI
jgi:hypothetical protein